MPIRMSSSLFQSTSLNALLDQQRKLSTTQLNISTGKRLTTPADDPIGASRLLNLRQQRQVTEQYQNNIQTATFRLNSEEERLTAFTEQLHKLRNLVIEAGNGSYDPNNLKVITSSIDGILDQMVDIGNTIINGEYIFAGAEVTSKPIVRNASGVYEYLGDENQRIAQVGSSITTVTNDTAKELFFGLESSKIDVSSVSGRVNLTSADPGLVAMTTGLATLNANDELILNGIGVRATTAADDTVSPANDNTKSAIALAAAINSSTSLHGVVASVNTNILNFTGGTYTMNALAAGNFVINGIDVVGAPATADAQGLADLVNSMNGGAGIDGVVASDNAGQLSLTASDGRNIQIQTNGVTASGITFTNFDLNNGAPLEQVKRGTITLNDHDPITIRGSSPADAGFTASVNNITANTGTTTLSNLMIGKQRPSGIADDEKYLIRFTSPTTYQIFRESNPSQAVIGDLEVFSAGSTLSQAVIPNYDISTLEIPYSDGDTVLFDSLRFTLSGTPVAGDTFTIDLQPEAVTDIFQTIQDVISNISAFSRDSQRLSYNLGVALNNIAKEQDKISEIVSQVGSRINLLESQEASNEEFIFFSIKGASEIEDLDIVSAISELVKQQLSFEAAQRSIVQIQRLSLFDFI